MKKNDTNQEYYYQNNNGYIKNKKLSKSLKNNTKKNTQILPQQSNNYFYNTKINHLILQEISNTNRDENIFEHPGIYKSIYINNNFVDKESDVSPPQSFYKKTNTSLQKLQNPINIPKNLNENENNSLNKEHKIGLNNFLISKKKDNNNIFSKSFLEDSHSKSNSNNKINNNKDRDKDKDKNNYNPFQVLNYLKKRNNKNNNIINFKNNKEKFNEKEKDDEIQKNNLSNIIYFSKDETLKNNNITNIEEKTHRNNQNYFYNLEEKNFFSTNSSKKNFIMNKLSNSNDFSHNKPTIKNCRNIPLKNSKIGNYYVKSPGMSYRNVNNANNNKCQKINVDKKNGCKSPEIMKKNLDLNNIKNETLNKYAYPYNKVYNSIYNGKIGFYKNNNEFGKASSINIRSNITQKKNLMNNNIRNKKNNSTINNNNRFNQANHNKNNSNEIKKEYVNIDLGTNSDNFMSDNDKKLNHSNDGFIKINSINQRLINNNEIENTETNLLTENRYENSIYKYYNKNKTSYNLLNEKIDKFCDILEQFFYNSFQKCFNFFIQKLNYYTEQKKSKRAMILRRLKDGKKTYKSSCINKSLDDEENNSRLFSNERKHINKEINDPRKKEKSPSKVIELQNNIKQTMMNVNQDNYIKMFNEIFKKQDRSVDDKKCRSPLLQRTRTNTNILKDSWDYTNDKKYEKYSTNTNVSLFLKKNSYNKFNDLKVNMDNYVQKSINNCFDNEYEDDNYDNNSNNYIFQKSYFRNSLSNDSKRNPLNNNINNIKAKKSINIKNNINKYEYDSSDGKKERKDNSVYYDNKIFQNQKYIISNSPETYFNKKNSDKRIYNKYIQNSQFSKNLLLYSKPLLKKPKESNSSINKMNIIYLKQNEMNPESIQKKKNLNASYSTILNNLSKIPDNNYNSQKNLVDSQIFNIEKQNKVKRKNKCSEIIIKNVSTQDKKLHVFIKYVEITNFKKQKTNINNKLFCNHIDSITFFSMNYNSSGKKGERKEKIYVYRNRYLNKKKDNLFREDKMFYSARNKEDFKESKNIKGVNDDNYKNKDKDEVKEKNKKNEDEEDEQSIQQNTINNSNSFDENNNHNNNNNENIKDSVIYLINFLQNMYNDNKKLILFNFFKNLKKIKTNSLLYFSMKTREKNKLKSLNNAQRNNNNKIIEISNYKNSSSYRMMNNSNDKDDFIHANKTSNLKYDINNSLIPKITRNKDNEHNLDCIISNSKKKEKPTLSKEVLNEISNENDKFNNKEKIDKRPHYNTTYNKTNSNNDSNINSTKNIIIYNKDNLDKKSSLLGDIKKLKEHAIKMKKMKEDKDDRVETDKNKNNHETTGNSNNKDKEKDKEKLKQIKLAKLGKIFKNLEQENNIITAIKEQFLEWSNNNDFGLKNNEKSTKDNEKGEKKYDNKTFNLNHMISSVFNSNNFEDKFENKLNIFKLELISFSLHGNNSKKGERKNKNRKFIEKSNRYKNDICANRYTDFKRRRNEYLNDEEEEDIIEMEDDKE